MNDFILAAVKEDYDFMPNNSVYAVKKEVQGMVATKLGVMLSAHLCGKINRVLESNYIWQRSLNGTHVYRGLREKVKTNAAK